MHGGIVQKAYDVFPEGCFIVDDVVCRSVDDDGFGAALDYFVCRICYAGCSVSAIGLLEDVPLRDFRNYLPDQGGIAREGDYQYVLCRNDSGQPFVGLPQVRFAFQVGRKELFRLGFPADRPEMVGASACHNYTIPVVTHSIELVIVFNSFQKNIG